MSAYNPSDYLPSANPIVRAIEARDAAWSAENAAIDADDAPAAFAARGRRLTAQREIDRLAAVRR